MTCRDHAHLHPGFHLCNDLIKPLFIVQSGCAEDLSDHLENKGQVLIQGLCFDPHHMGSQPVIPGITKNLDSEKDSSCPGINLVKQFSIGIMLCIYITQD